MHEGEAGDPSSRDVRCRACWSSRVEEAETDAPRADALELTPEERAVLAGEQGEARRKAMDSVVKYGEVFGARRLVEIEGAPHLVTSFGTGAMKPFFAMLDELIAAGVRSTRPFTVNPRPVDYANVRYGLADRVALRLLYGKQRVYEAQLARLGLRDADAFSCTCYLPEVDNAPPRDAVLAWSESSAVVFANSILGARTNRNAAGIDLLCNVLGKAPVFGLLTGEGRRATWLVDVRTSALPEAQLLGSAVGQRVVDGVPYITGLDRWLGPAEEDATVAYLKDMGAAAASNGAVGLFHVEGVTPEALDAGRALVADAPGQYVVDDEELARVLRAYPVMWARPDAAPRQCFIGCPHLTTGQLEGWTERILAALREAGRAKLAVETYLCAAPQVHEAFRGRRAADHAAALRAGLRFTALCPLMFMSNPLARKRPVVTNSTKLRTYTTARYFRDDDVLRVIVHGDVEAVAP
jgi:predicted aconitase